ncbi:hypothetical protein P7C71_g4767, partial [Lecanoromycetidae sp. Uapishka_2]
MAPGSIPHSCVKCGGAATSVCKGCKSMPDGAGGTINIYYCGGACQKAHWSTHKAQCKLAQIRQALYRAGDLAKAMFQMMRKVTWKTKFSKMEKASNLWIMHHPAKYTGKSFMLPFQSVMFPEKQDEEAILSWLSCADAVDHMHYFVKFLLKDFCSEVDEISHLTKNTKLRIFQRFISGGLDGTDYAHTVIRATLKNGEKYIMDMTGAQYRWPETITPWEQYQDVKIASIKQILPFGGTAAFCKKRAEDMAGHRLWVHQVDNSFAEALGQLLNIWQKMNLSLGAMLNLPDSDFRAKRMALLGSVENDLQMFKAYNEQIGQYDIKGEVTWGDAHEAASGREYKIVKGLEAAKHFDKLVNT